MCNLQKITSVPYHLPCTNSQIHKTELGLHTATSHSSTTLSTETAVIHYIVRYRLAVKCNHFCCRFLQCSIITLVKISVILSQFSMHYIKYIITLGGFSFVLCCSLKLKHLKITCSIVLMSKNKCFPFLFSILLINKIFPIIFQQFIWYILKYMLTVKCQHHHY